MAQKGEGIHCIVTVGNDPVANGLLPDDPDSINDVISIRTEITGAEEGAANAKCTLVLHNNHQVYGRKIASGEWKQGGQTTVSIIIHNNKNMVNGTETHTEHHDYIAFWGILGEVSFDATTATLDVVSVDGVLEQAHFEDQVYQAERANNPAQVFSELIYPELQERGVSPVVIDRRVSKLVVQRKWEADSSQSTIANIQTMADTWVFWTYCDPQASLDSPSRSQFLILDADYTNKHGSDISDYVTKQGFKMSVEGYANFVDCQVDTAEKSNTPAHQVTSSTQNDTGSHDRWDTTDGTDTPIRWPQERAGHGSDGTDGSKIVIAALKAKLGTKLNAKMEATVAGIVPYMYEMDTYHISNGIDLENSIKIIAKVTKAVVEYSSRGLIANMIMKRNQVTVGGIVTDEPSNGPGEDEPTPMTPDKRTRLANSAAYIGNDGNAYFFNGSDWITINESGGWIVPGSRSSPVNPPADVLALYNEYQRTGINPNDVLVKYLLHF
jgi:hypothetical protein